MWFFGFLLGHVNLLALPQHQHTSFLCPNVSDRIALSFFKELFKSSLKKDRAILSETSGQRKLVCWCWGRAKRYSLFVVSPWQRSRWKSPWWQRGHTYRGIVSWGMCREWTWSLYPRDWSELQLCKRTKRNKENKDDLVKVNHDLLE